MPFTTPWLPTLELFVNPSSDQLRELAKHHETTTQFGSASYVTQIRNRSAKKTYVVEDGFKTGLGQQSIRREDAEETIAEVLEHLKTKSMIAVERTMGLNDSYHINCRLYIDKKYARIAYMWHNSLFQPRNGEEASYEILEITDDLVGTFLPFVMTFKKTSTKLIIFILSTHILKTMYTL